MARTCALHAFQRTAGRLSYIYAPSDVLSTDIVNNTDIVNTDIVNNRAIDSTVNVRSSGNRFYENGAGTIVLGALSSNDTRADGNTITFEAHGDWFVGNTRETEFDDGGLVVLGAEDISVTGGGSNKTVHV